MRLRSEGGISLVYLEVMFSLVFVALVVVAVLGIVLTGRERRVSYTISQHIGSNKAIAAMFGVVCAGMGLLLLMGMPTSLVFVATASAGSAAFFYYVLLALWWVFAGCLVGIGVFPHLPDESHLSSRIHQRVVRVQFLAMIVICVLLVALWGMGIVGWLLALASAVTLMASLVFGVLYMVRREVLKPRILIWESGCIVLFIGVAWLVFGGF